MLANSKSDAFTLGRSAREIAALCDKHSVPCGAPEDLALLLRALDENKHLAMEFWSLVARATERNAAAATDPKALLSAIVEAVTAQPLAEFESAGPAQRLLVKRTAAMLAGEDIHAPITPDPIATPEIPFPTPKAKPEPAPAETPLPHRGRQLRLVLNPDPPKPPTGSDPEPNPAPFAIPLAAYADSEPNRSTWPRLLAGALILAVIATSWFMLRHNPSALDRADNAIRSAYASAISGLKPHTSPQPTAPQAQPEAQPAQAQTPQAQAPPAQTAQSQPSAPPPAEPTPQQTPASAPAATLARDRDANSDLADTPQVVVPEALMRQNLISSRFPVVPNPADNHGIVVLEAVITSRGTVEHLRAISGDPALRRAAIEAASTWHYRPYLLNGTPIDVATTISVDFSGND